MKRLFPIICVLSCFIAAHSFAGSATWNINPTSGDWNTAANWMPATVPNGSADTATFATSAITDLSISAGVELTAIVFEPGADTFTITTNPGVALTISGAGVINSSGTSQNFVTLANLEDAAQIFFTNGASAGDSVVYTNKTPFNRAATAPLIQFEDNSTAGSAQFINTGGANYARGTMIEFKENSTAGNGTFRNIGPSSQESPVEINFRDQATAGEAMITNEGDVNFYGNSTADHATIVNGGFSSSITFYDNATAADATITNEGGKYYLGYGGTIFGYNSTAAESTVIANGSQISGGDGYAIVDLGANATAGNAIFIANGGQVAGAGGGQIRLLSTATAENGTFYANGATVDGASGGRVYFTLSDPTAATSTLIATGGTGGNDGGGIIFHYSSVGAEARVELFGNGFLDVQLRDTPELTIGSLAGDGLVLLGQTNLSIGSNNLNTRFSGVIQGARRGAITKIGSASLTLSGTNTYTGGTTIEAGVLVVNNQTGSGTGSGPVQVNAGRLGGRGVIAGAAVVGTGSGSGAILAPSKENGKPNSITIQGPLTFNSDATYECGVNTKGARADKVVANGVIINGGQFTLRDPRGVALTPGTVLTVIDNTSANSISGTFANLVDGSTITVGANKLQVSYSGGDGNDLTLTVVP